MKREDHIESRSTETVSAIPWMLDDLTSLSFVVHALRLCYRDNAHKNEGITLDIRYQRALIRSIVKENEESDHNPCMFE